MAAAALAILLARFATGTDLAARYPLIATGLFVWIASDALMLSLVARSPDRKPSPSAVIGALAAAALVVLLSAARPVRETLAAMPLLTGALLLLVAVQAGWIVAKVVSGFRNAREQRIEAAFAAVLPAPLLRFAQSEIALLRCLFAPPRAQPWIPQGASGFACHSQTAPMLWVLLVLQAIELSVTHLLISHWSERAAIVLSLLTAVGIVYLVGFIRSLRLLPILLTAEGLHIRTGLLMQRFVRYEDIAEVAAFPPSEAVNAADTLNMAVLAWPNMIVRLRQPLPRRRHLRARPPLAAIAFRPDRPDEFLVALRARLPD
ncbi:hypothetical protein [Novosphingobium aquimarinum]|uniref:hypothetical protein n=1 Tax=Novosphingobium aquimarinum TaxID=2682494 RepID=UPI0012ECAE5C|nr:hypothetical protein [Novosphingobium aquimarinum]